MAFWHSVIVKKEDLAERERQIPYDITYMWTLKYDTNVQYLSMKQKQTHRHREWICGCQVGAGEGKDWEFGISRCKLFYIRWINNKVLLYGTGNYIQYPVINHNGKEYEKEHVCITESLCCTAEINTL